MEYPDLQAPVPADPRKTICLDFDGVLHQNLSVFQGPDVIPDPPVPGAREAVERLRQRNRVVVNSARCATIEGRAAIAVWLVNHGIRVDHVAEHKPPADMYIDDRALRFDGDWLAMLEKIGANKPR